LKEASDKEVRRGEDEKEGKKSVVEEIDHYIKSEIRISKPETNPKFKCSNSKTFTFWSFVFRTFVLVSDFVLRNSIL